MTVINSSIPTRLLACSALILSSTVLIHTTGPGRVDAAVVSYSGVAATAAPDAGTPGVGNDPRFGAVQAFEAPRQAAAIGIRWERIMFPWKNIQPSGSGDWNAVPPSSITATVVTPAGQPFSRN